MTRFVVTSAATTTLRVYLQLPVSSGLVHQAVRETDSFRNVLGVGGNLAHVAVKPPVCV